MGSGAHEGNVTSPTPKRMIVPAPSVTPDDQRAVAVFRPAAHHCRIYSHGSTCWKGAQIRAGGNIGYKDRNTPMAESREANLCRC